MHWSKLKQRVEERFAGSVAGRVELRLTSYRHAHDGLGRGWITVDGIEVASMCYWRSLREGSYDVRAVTEPGEPPRNAGAVMPPYIFTQTLVDYLSLSIEQALASPSFLVRALAQTSPLNASVRGTRGGE
jgi:hypothetical protein